MTAAYSRIMDVDMAEEMTEYTTMQVISQASMSMLAQANERLPCVAPSTSDISRFFKPRYSKDVFGIRMSKI